MAPEQIKGLLKRIPFKPFVLVLTNGDRHPVHHPELLWVTEEVLGLGTARPGDPEGLAKRIVWLSPDHVMKIEPLEPAATQS
jgi:hypothetical protein